MAVDYDEQTALLVLDLQNDFADPAGGLAVEGGEEIIPAINREIDRASAAGALIVYTQDWHPPSTRHFRKDGGPWPVHCVRQTWGAQLHPSVRRVRAATVILKGVGGEDGYSAFRYRHPETGREGRTALEATLRRRHIRRVVLTGLTTDYCVRFSALDALRTGLEVVVLEDAVRAIDRRPGDGARALREIARRGAVIVSGEEPTGPSPDWSDQIWSPS